MATKAKNVRMTKANIKMLNYIMKLEKEKDEHKTFAQLSKDRGLIDDIYDNHAFRNAANAWHYAIEMYQEVNGLTDHDYWHGNSYGYIYDVKENNI